MGGRARKEKTEKGVFRVREREWETGGEGEGEGERGSGKECVGKSEREGN